MTTFDALESSLEGSRPIELYTFAIGGEVFRYTSAEDDITIGVDTWMREAIERGSVGQGPDRSRQGVDLTMPAANAFAQRWLARPPGVPGSVTIIRIQRDEATFGLTQTVVFKGVVRGVQFPDTGRSAKITTTSILAARSRSIPRYRFAAQCGHFHYGLGCKVATAANTFSGTVSAESGSDLTVPGLGVFSSRFPAGFVRPVSFTDFRQILSQSGDVITLRFPFPVSMVGQQVDVLKGCDRSGSGDCTNEYANFIEYGGFPFVPRSNPFEVGI